MMRATTRMLSLSSLGKRRRSRETMMIKIPYHLSIGIERRGKTLKC
jgi:hypothetical protein